MSKYVAFVCDRCRTKVGNRPEGQSNTVCSVRVDMTGDLTGAGGDMTSTADLNFCDHCQPFVAALLAGLFSADIIATRPETLLPHGETWIGQPISLSDEIERWTTTPLSAYMGV